MRILNFYIIKELTIPSLLSLLVLTFVLLLTKILNLAEILFERDVKPEMIFNILGSIALYLTGITLPLAFLMGLLMCFGRLSSDAEIIALRTSGISLLRIFFPVLIVALFLFSGSLILHHSILPRANWHAENTLKKLAQDVSHLFEEKTWMEGFGKNSIYIKKLIPPNEFRHICLHQPVDGFTLPRIIRAEKGEFSLDDKQNILCFILQNGHIEEPSPNEPSSFYIIHFGEYNVSIPITKRSFADESKKAFHLTFTELEKQIKSTPKDETHFRSLIYEKHSRISMAFACIVFLIMGFPLTIHFQRSEKSANFVLGGSLALIWYLLMILGRALSLRGIIPIVPGTWLPNFILGTFGLILLIKFLRK